jgi:hypothetical protein
LVYAERAASKNLPIFIWCLCGADAEATKNDFVLALAKIYEKVKHF